ncbi:MAG: hypothetical protein B7Z80_01690 [Rhodospirillales bacterium 20-64-7]|nr:MAG: hypothetical protein B7Z80_01690 [Rhodospirillales bacterium 20-64-7]
MRDRESIRFQLILAMILVFGLGLGGAIALHPFEERGSIVARYIPVVIIPEPYQDFSVIFLFSLICGVIIWFVSGWSLRGLAAASREASNIGPTRPNARISLQGLPSEIRPLVEAINGALDRLAHAYANEKQFVADAAHQLRTPLAVLKLRLQMEGKRARPDWNSINADLFVTERLVGDLLRLAEREGNAVMSCEIGPANMARCARETIALLMPLAEHAGRSIETDLPNHLVVDASADDIKELIRNLLENAILHGAGTVRVEAHSEAGFAVLTVEDEGPGLPDSLKETAFARFWKKSPNSQGSGLGLSIARQIAQANGGTLNFLPGDRAAIRLSVPLSHPADAGHGTGHC